MSLQMYCVGDLLPVTFYNWGERIRTSEWLDQNQLPYHLATPQRLNIYYTNIPTW